MKNFKYKLLFVLAIMMFFAVPANAQTQLVPVGRAVGIQLYTDGLLVIGTTEVNGRDVARECGIETGDRITAANGVEIDSSENLASIVNEHSDSLALELIRDNRKMTIDAVPVQAEDGVYRLGIWVRDSCAGVGTVTYYDPETNTYAALGHAVNDVDTGNILPVKRGNILDCSIMSVTKSSRGCPGEINAVFGDEVIGDLSANTYEGIFGKTSNNEYFSGEPMTVAARNQVHKGEAYILSDIMNGKTEKYSIKIKKITDDADKGLVIEVTDDRLIDSAGGIVQGMSGSPIIQDNMFVGAVTHVFVNSPQKGYGTLAENMIDMQCKCM